MQFSIGYKFKVKYKDNSNTYINAEIIGIYYDGDYYNTALKRGELLKNNTKMFQLLVQFPYGEKIQDISEQKFLNTIEEDKKLAQDYKTYHLT